MEEGPEIKTMILRIEEQTKGSKGDISELIYRILARATDMVAEYVLKRIE